MQWKQTSKVTMLLELGMRNRTDEEQLPGMMIWRKLGTWRKHLGTPYLDAGSFFQLGNMPGKAQA